MAKQKKNQNEKLIYSDTTLSKNKTDSNSFELEKKLHYIFFFVCVFIGSYFALKTPPFQVPDEIDHFKRVYILTEFKILQIKTPTQSGGYVPKNAVIIDSTFGIMRFNPNSKTSKSTLKKLNEYEFDSSNLVFANIGMGAYSPICYFPQMLAIYYGKFFPKTSLLDIMKLGRFLSVLFCALIISFAISISRNLKWIIFFVGILPMSTFLFGSYSADSMTISICIFFISFIFYLSQFEQQITIKQLAYLFLLLISISLCKQVYFVLAGLVIIIPQKRFNSIFDKYIKLFLILLLPILINICWYLFIAKVNFSVESGQYAGGGGMNEQLDFVIQNPFKFLTIVLATFKAQYSFFFLSSIGVLGYLDTVFTNNVYALFFASFIIALILSSKNSGEVTLVDKILILGIVIGIIILLAIASYIGITPYKYEIVLGLQGRYFLPFLPLILILFMKNINILNNKNLRVFLQIAFFTILLFAYISVFNQFNKRYFY